MPTIVKRLITFALAHKMLTAILCIALAASGWWSYRMFVSGDDAVRYVFGTVERGAIVQVVSASGQVSSSDEVSVRAKVSGDVVWVGVKNGQSVSQGQALLSLENSEAAQAVKTAELDLEEARITLEHDTAQAPIDYAQTKNAVENAERDLANEYEDAYTAMAELFVDVPDIIADLDGILYDEDIEQNFNNTDALQNIFVSYDDDLRTVRKLAERAETDYAAARSEYERASTLFRALSRAASKEDMERALAQGAALAEAASQAAVSEAHFLDTIVDILDRRSLTVGNDVTTVRSSSHLTLSAANAALASITDAKKSLENAQETLKDARDDLTLASIGNPDGTNPFDLQLLRNDVAKKEAALAEAKQTLADHAVRAPLSGTLTSFETRRGDSVSSGESVGVVITDQQVAELSLNEVDAAKVQVGNEAVLTFDAVEKLRLKGEVSEVDAVGTVEQGVVSYTVRVTFDASSERVKPGMTVNASITTATKEGVLTVPASAVKTSRGAYYIQTFDPVPVGAEDPQGVATDAAPVQIPVEIGISDDNSIEIVSGLEEGQRIIVRTTGSAAQSSSASSDRGGMGSPGMIRF